MNRHMKKGTQNIKLTSIFSFSICVILLFTAAVTYGGTLLLKYFNIVKIDYPVMPLLFFEMISIVAGTVAASVISRRILKPLDSIISATEQIAKGDFSTRLELEYVYEFEQLSTKFNCMAEELGSVEMLRNDFINHFSHEFNTPINSIQGFATVLKKGNLTPEQQADYLNRIINSTDRLSNLAVNVLNLSKIEQQTILTHKEKMNVTEQIRQVIVMLSFRWEQKQIEFDFNCPEYYLVGNEEFLEHLWSNLLDNAIKYSPIGSVIEIDINDADENLEIIITDHGKGIAPEALPHIFDKFYRSESSKAVPGTGLGLAISHKVVLLHGGRIDVKTHLGEGTSFTIVLPKE